MINSIESSIIAYFDNRLSDAERVDLLRQVHESEDARKLFRQHEVLRSLVQRAQARAVVDADTENLLFSRISPIGKSLVTRPWIVQPVPAIRIFMGALAATALIILGVYFASPHLSGKVTHGGQQIASTSANSSTDLSDRIDPTDGRISSIEPGLEVRRDNPVQVSKTRTRVENSSNSPVFSSKSEATLQYCNMPDRAAAKFSDGRYPLSEIHSLASLPESNSPSGNNFVLSLQADSPPIDDRHFPGLSGGTASFGYCLTGSDILSAQFGYYSSRLFPPSSESQALLATVKHNDHFVNILSGGLEIEHQYMAYDGRLIISGALGAGLQSYGNYVSINLSAATPIGRGLLTGIGISVSHENFSTSSWTVQDPVSPTGSSQWTNLEGKYFATAKIYYMVSYGF